MEHPVFSPRPGNIEKEAKSLSSMKAYAIPSPQENARCKVCFRKFQAQEFFKLCTICERKVCEDCSAYATKEPEVSTLFSLFQISLLSALMRKSNQSSAQQCKNFTSIYMIVSYIIYQNVSF